MIEQKGARSTGRVCEDELGPVAGLVAIPEAVSARHPLRRHRSPANERVHVPREQTLGPVVAGDVHLLGVGQGHGAEGQPPGYEDEMPWAKSG